MSVLDHEVGRYDHLEVKRISVAICVATKCRPYELSQLLDSIAALHTDGFDISVYLADNDPAHGARSVVDGFTERSTIPVSLAQEPIPGYAAVRNCSLRMVPPDVDWVAFIDDDEIASPEWLSSLLATASLTGANLVCGPVVPEVNHPLPQWRVDLASVGHPGMADGVEVEAGYTGNLLVRRRLLSDRSFDLRFGATGGEDSDLTLRLRAAGERIVYSSHALVRTPADLCELETEALIKRVSRDTANYTHVICWQQGSLPARIRLRTVARLVQSVGLWGFGVATGNDRCATVGHFRAARSLAVLRAARSGYQPPPRRGELSQ